MSEISKYRQSEEAAWNLLEAERQATKRLREQVAAQAAVIEKLREALESTGINDGEYGETQYFDDAKVEKALAIQTNSTQILAEVRRAERDELLEVVETAYKVASEHDDRLPFDWAVYCEMLYQTIASVKEKS